METTFEMESLEQLKAFSHPVRYQVINLLILKPMTGAQLARSLKMPRQRMHYHLKILRQAGLILPVNEQEARSPVEIFYRSVAENFSSSLLTGIAENAVGTAQAESELRLQTLSDLMFTMAEQAKADLAQPDTLARLLPLSLPFQHAVFLTPEQATEAHEAFQAIKQKLLRENEENLACGSRSQYLSVRYTLLVTPCYCEGEEG